MVSRMIGVSGAIFYAAANTMITVWFTGPRLSLVFSLLVSVGRVAICLSFVVFPNMSDTYGVLAAALFGLGLCSLSVLSGALTFVLDYRN